MNEPERKDEEYLLDSPWAGVIVTVWIVILCLGLFCGFICAIGYLMGY